MLYYKKQKRTVIATWTNWLSFSHVDIDVLESYIGKVVELLFFKAENTAI